MLIHWIWLSRLPKVTARQKTELLKLFHDPEEIFGAGEEALCRIEGMTEQAVQALCNKDMTDARKILRDCSEKSISILTFGDGAYPHRLKNTEDPPLVLYYKGCLPDWENVPVIGVVGTRKASAYGLQIAGDLGCEIASCGALLVSGGADGIDTRAMEGALQAGKKVVAVLGFGADIVYPAKNRSLFERVEKQGCLLTEYVPGTPPYSWNFPKRNRIISGLSAGILVVEAPEKSGALNTAHHAMEQGRDIFVVPGNINTPSCAGSNALLRERAIPVFKGWDVVREYEGLYPGVVCPNTQSGQHIFAVAQTAVYPETQPKQRKSSDNKFIDKQEKSRYSVLESEKPNLTPEEQAVVRLLSDKPCPVDTVIAQSDLPSGKVLSILTVLALKGVVKNHPGKCVSLK